MDGNESCDKRFQIIPVFVRRISFRTLVCSAFVSYDVSPLFGLIWTERRDEESAGRKIGPCTLNGHGRPREIREARVPVRRRIYNTFLSVTSAG